MPSTLRPLAFFTLASVLLSAPILAADADAALGPNLVAFFDQAAENGFSGAVMVARHGQTVLHQGYGLADQDTQATITRDTIFDVGGVSRQFTRAAVLKLREQGRLALRDPLSRFFPEIPQDKAAITVAMLLENRAGFQEHHALEGDFGPIDRDEAQHRIFAQELLFPPGQGQAESDSGSTLLAILIEKTSGETYSDYLRKHLLDPADMHHSGFYGDAGWRMGEVAVGHSVLGEVSAPQPWAEASWTLVGNGGLMSTAADLNRWIQAVRHGDVLSPGSRYMLYSENLERQVITYGGADKRGFATLVIELPAEETYLIVTSNNDQGLHAGLLEAPLIRLMHGDLEVATQAALEAQEPL